jgi:enoyl-CoA hydratase
MSVYKQWDLDLVEALKNEGREGLQPLRAEAKAGATRFASGRGRADRSRTCKFITSGKGIRC